MKQRTKALAELAAHSEPYRLAFWSQVMVVGFALLFPVWLLTKTPSVGASIAGGLSCLLAILSTVLVDLLFRGRRLVSSLREELSIDPLTGVLSRAAVLQLGQRELERASRSGAPMGVLFVDLDHFKWINDTHGHAAGDEVLRRTAQRLLREVRGYDAVGRYGGDEFVVMLPECDFKGLSEISERLRCAATEPITVAGDHCIEISLSIGGLADLPLRHDLDSMLSLADEALYAAKRAGRNRVALVPPDPSAAEMHAINRAEPSPADRALVEGLRNGQPVLQRLPRGPEAQPSS